MTDPIALRGTLNASPTTGELGVVGACVMCGGEAWMLIVPRGRPELGPQPMHLSCSARLIQAYRRYLDAQLRGELPEPPKLLTDGRP